MNIKRKQAVTEDSISDEKIAEMVSAIGDSIEFKRTYGPGWPLRTHLIHVLIMVTSLGIAQLW